MGNSNPKPLKLKSLLNEITKDVGKYPISAKAFKSYVKEYAREIKAGKKYFSKEDWAIAEPVANYMLKAKTPANIDEFIKWHDGAKKITGGKSFGMGSGFADAADGMIVDILTDNPNLTDKDVDFIDIEVLPYIEKKAK